MGSLMSKVPEIAKLRFVSIQGTCFKVEKIGRADGTTVALLANGALWSPQINGGYSYTPGEFSTPVLRLLVKMGRLTKDQVDQHVAAVDRLYARNHRRSEGRTFAVIAKRYGLKLTRQQVKVLEIEAIA